MKSLSTVMQVTGLIALTGLALFFGAGCTDQNQLDTGPVSNSSVIPIYFGVEIWNVCVPSFGGMYDRYTVAVSADGSTQTLADDTTDDLSDCDYSVGTQDQVDPSAVQASFGQTSTSAPPPPPSAQFKPRAASSGQHPVDALPYGRPLPFAPVFSPQVAKSVPASCDPNGSFYAVNHGDNLVTHFASCTLKVIDTIPVFANPLHPALTPDGTLLLVTSNAGAVNFISTATDKVVYTLQTPGVYPSGIAISPDGNTAYVTDYDTNSQILVIDIPSHTITTMIALPEPYPKQIFLTPDGAQAWVNFYSNTEIYIIDTLSNTVVTPLNTSGIVSTGMAFNATGTKVFIAALPSDLYIYDTASLTRIADVQVGASPVDVTLTPDGGRVYVTSFESPTVSIVDAHTNQLLANVMAPAADQRAFSLDPLVP